MTNAERFEEIYLAELREQMARHPELYAYPIGDAPSVATKMTAALAKGSANKDSIAIKHTCKRLGIAYRYADIAAYLVGAAP
jgi:hypothetical protein